MAAPIIAVFTDGEPKLLSLEALRDLIGVSNLEAQLQAAAAAQDGRLSAIVAASSKGLQQARAELLSTFEQIEPIQAQFGPITSDISALEQASVDASLALEALGGAVADRQVAQRQADAAVGRIEEALLRAVLESARTRDVLRDAGIVVDPTDGTVRIYAIDQLRDRTSRAEVLVDGVKSLVQTKASVSYVDEQLALAVLNPEQVAQLEPILARLTQAESQIDGLNAAVRLKASVDELTALTVRTRIAEIAVDALKGQIALTATADAVDRLTLRTSSIEQTLTSLPDTAGLVVEVRQARGEARNAENALLQSLAAGEVSGRYQISQIAQARQELSTRMDDGFSAAALARTQLSVAIDRTQAAVLSESQASVTRDGALTQRIDAQGVTLGNQAAAIGRLDTASVSAAGGIASAQMTIRQLVGADGESGEALLRSIAAGESAGQTRAAQLVQIQTEFTTTLLAGQRSEAVAREALLARMGQAEAAIVATSKVVSDLNQASATRIVALEAAFNDAATGLVATRARIVALEDTTAKADAAAAQRLDLVEASVNDPATGLVATRATVAQDREASVTRDNANARDIQQLSGQVNDPATGLPATAAGLAQERTVSADRDAARSREIQVLSAQVNDPGTGLSAVSATVASNKQAQVDGDKALGDSLQQVSTTVNGQTASINFLMRSIDGKEAVAQLTTDVAGKVTGFKINGKESVFAIAADKFIVGASQIFEVDATTGVVRMNDVIVKRLAAGVVDTDQLVGNAVSDTTAQDFTGNAVNGALGNFVNITTFNVTTTKTTDRVLLMVSGVLNANAEATSGTVTSVRLNLRLIRSDGTVIRSAYTALSETTSGAYGPVTLIDLDVPGSVGTYTYQLQGSVSKTGGSGTQGATISVIDGTFVATVLKR